MKAIVAADKLPPLSADARSFYGYLQKGTANATRAAEIQQQLGISPRKQQELVDELILHGLFVCSSCSATRPGYYIPSGAAEVVPFLAQLDHRMSALNAKRQALLGRWPELRPTVRPAPRRTIRPTGCPAAQTLDFGDCSA